MVKRGFFELAIVKFNFKVKNTTSKISNFNESKNFTIKLVSVLSIRLKLFELFPFLESKVYKGFAWQIGNITLGFSYITLSVLKSSKFHFENSSS